MSFDLGECEEHKSPHRYCGFTGVPHLGFWADSKRARWRYEPSYKAERDAHVKGDGRYYVELLGHSGTVSPFDASFGSARVKGQLRNRILALDPNHYVAQQEDKRGFCIVRFLYEPHLEGVLQAIGLRYRRSYSPEQRQKMAERLMAWQFRRRTGDRSAQGDTQDGGNG